MATLLEMYDDFNQAEMMKSKEGLKFLVALRRDGQKVSDMTQKIIEIMSDSGMSTEELTGYLQYLKIKISSYSYPAIQK